MELAISRARKLSADDINEQMVLVRTAVADFCRGQHCEHYWRSLADTANIAETLASMRLGAGDEADQVIANAQQVLHDVRQRRAERGTWTLYADEIEALHWLVSLHDAQLHACSYGEFETAYRRTACRIQQAVAGNAGPGTILVVGDIHPLSATEP